MDVSKTNYEKSVKRAERLRKKVEVHKYKYVVLGEIIDDAIEILEEEYPRQERRVVDGGRYIMSLTATFLCKKSKRC